MALTLVLNGDPFDLADGYDEAELRTRIAQALFRGEVEQVHLAGGATMLVNWRAVVTVQLHATEPHAGSNGSANLTSSASVGV